MASSPPRSASKMRTCTSKHSGAGMTPAQPARSASGSSSPPRPLNTVTAGPSASTVAAASSAEASPLSSTTFGCSRQSRRSISSPSPTPIYCGAFWMATGTGAASATSPKKCRRSVSARGRRGGGCRITQAAPRSAARRTKSICTAGVSPNTVIATGNRPATSSRHQAITWRRSSGESLATSVARPRAATPWAPPCTMASTWRCMAPRSSLPSDPKKA